MKTNHKPQIRIVIRTTSCLRTSTKELILFKSSRNVTRFANNSYVTYLESLGSARHSSRFKMSLNVRSLQHLGFNMLDLHWEGLKIVKRIKNTQLDDSQLRDFVCTLLNFECESPNKETRCTRGITYFN